MARQVAIYRGRTLILSHIRCADSFGSRLRGLMFYKAFPEIDGLLIYPCSSIHTYWMRFPLDIVFLDRDGAVINLISELAPNRVIPKVAGAHYTLEVRTGSIRQLKIELGDRLEITNTSQPTTHCW